MNVELAYLAGYLDGDGAVMLAPVRRSPGAYLFTLMVGSSSEAQCRLFEAVFGGCVCRHKTTYIRRDGSPTIYYEWRVTQQKAEEALGLLGPYLRLKKGQALLGSAYRARVGRRGQAVGSAEKVKREALHTQMTKLNARGRLIPLRRLGPPVPLPSGDEELAYLGGLFDAEGTISWVKDRQRVVPLLHVGVVNTTDLACWSFALRFGGRVNEVHRAGRGIFSWYLRQRKALPVLQALLPYLREKRAAAEVALQRGIRPARRATVLPFVQKEGA